MIGVLADIKLSIGGSALCPRELLADIFLALNQSIREGMKSDLEITRTG